MTMQQRPLLRKSGRALKAAAIFLLIFVAITFIGGWLASVGMQHPDEVASFRAWMSAHRYGLLAWRLVVYAFLVWMFLKIWNAPGLKAEYRRPLVRIVGVSILFVLVCEYSIFSAAGN